MSICRNTSSTSSPPPRTPRAARPRPASRSTATTAAAMSCEIIRDSRVIYVQPREELKIDIKADKNVFTPGETGQIQFLVTDAKGKGVQAALGIIVVDEAVYALQEMQPGLEKVYFTLQE